MIYYDVDTALAEVPVNAVGLTDDGDFKTLETSVAYNASGMSLEWHFVTSAGAYTVTSVTPTTGGTYDWAHQGKAKYTIEIPASGGASINNDTEGYGWFEGTVTGVLPFRGPTLGFRAAALNDAMNDVGDLITKIADAVVAAFASEAGTAQAGGASSITLRAGASATTDLYVDQSVFVYSGTGAGQTNRITAYNGTTKVATVVDAWAVQPDNTSKYLIIGRVE